MNATTRGAYLNGLNDSMKRIVEALGRTEDYTVRAALWEVHSAISQDWRDQYERFMADLSR